MISAIILAAGEGKRIGATKALLNRGNENLINYQINSLSHKSITEKIVVVGSESEKVHHDPPPPAVSREQPAGPAGLSPTRPCGDV